MECGHPRKGGESMPLAGDVTSCMQELSSNGLQAQASLEEGNNETFIVFEENGLERSDGKKKTGGVGRDCQGEKVTSRGHRSCEVEW
ncbi:unnamed protein product [Prunus armeniaca]|uniref:Uncharacterized protein n=1 Tax=Prunus armeniaca TaxID=36596 RepID=A0A6J5TMH6_PRUAR|nr:unnamed protein product [Prunus armeniaca]